MDLEDTGTKVCGAGSIKCYETAKLKLFGQDLIDGLQDTKAKTFRKKCYCLPACTSITYDLKIECLNTIGRPCLVLDKNENDHLLGYEICVFLNVFILIFDMHLIGMQKN